MSVVKMVDATTESSSDPSCSSCAKMKEALEASKKEHSLTLRMVKEKIISTDELIKKYQQKCHESDKHHQQATDTTLKLESAQVKIESLQSQLDRSMHSSEPLRKNVARLHREKSLADSAISDLREKLQNFEKTNAELLSTAKVKEEQECAWRLEKQLQAHEMQKQKKSLQKNETTIAKLQEQLKKEKEQNKELNRLLSQAKKKTTKLEKELEKSKEEIQSVKLDAEFAKVLGDDLDETPKRRQRQKARKTPQVPKELKQTSPSSPHLNQPLAHIIEELTVLSDIGPALSPLPASPDRGTLESSSGSEDGSGSGSDREDDGNASDNGDSDYSLGDLADILIGDNNDDAKLEGCPMKTRNKAKDVENNFEKETKASSDADIEKTESGSSLGQALNEDNSFAHCDVDDSKEDTPNLLTMIQKNDIQTRINGNSAKINSEPCNTEKGGDESSKTVKLSKAEKHKAVMPSPQRTGKRKVASPKPRVMTRSRAKAMKLSTSSDGDSSPEKGTGNEMNLTQEHEMSDTCLKRNSKAGKVENLNEGSSGNDENGTTDVKKAFTEGLKGKELKVHVEEKSQSLLSDSPSSGDVDVIHHHGNVREPVSSVASFSGSNDQVCKEDDSNVFSAEVDADVTHHHRNDGELVHFASSLPDSESQVANEDTSGVILAEVVEDATHHHSNDVELDNSRTIANEDNSHVSSVFEVKAPTNLSTKLEIDSEQEFSVTYESGYAVKDDASPIMCKQGNDVIPSPEDSQEKSECTLTNDLTNTEKGDTSQGSQNTSIIGGNTLTSQLHVDTKEEVFERRDKPLEENNNNFLRELEAVCEKLEVDSVDLLDNKDSCDQTEPIVQEIPEHSSFTIERKCSDLSESSTTCVGGKNENGTNGTASSFEVESNSDFLCEVSGKETSAFIDSSQDETAEIRSSTVEVGFNPLTMNYKKRTTTITIAVAEATATTETERSTGSHKDETSQDSNLLTKGDNLLHYEAMQYHSADEQEVECSEGHGSSAQEEISILTTEPSGKCFDLEGDVPSSRNEIQERSSTSGEVKESSNLEREMPFCRIAISEKEQFSTFNEETKHSDCTRVVPPSKTVAEETRGPTNSNEGGFGHRVDMSSRTTCISKGRSLTSNEEKKHSDRGKDVIASGAVSKPPTFNKGIRPSGSKQDKSYHDGKTVIQKARESAGPTSSPLDAEKIGLEGSETSLTLSSSPKETVPTEGPSAVHDTQDDSPMKDLFNNLECLLDDFPALSPLPPSPCPSDDEVCPASPNLSTDLNTEKVHCATNLTSTKTSFQTPGTSPMKRNQTLIFTEVASKSMQRTSLGNSTACCTTRANRTGMSVKSFPVKDKKGVSDSTPCTRGNVSMKRSLQQPSSTRRAGENLSLKRSFQQSVSESAKDQNVASQNKKMKTNSKLTQKQGTSNLEKPLDTPKAMGKADPSKQPSKDDGANNGPILVANDKPILATNDGQMEEDNDGPTLKEALKTASNSTKAAGGKQSKCNGLSIRPSHMPEVKYVFRCLSRVYEDNVDLHVLVERLTTKRCISSSTPVASAIVQFLKEREDCLMPQILDQLEQFQCNDNLKSWKPVHSGFESRLLEVLTLLTSNALFRNLIPQLVTLCSRSLMTDCCSLNGVEVKKGDLSLCRILTALCLLKEDLGCARTVCYDIIRCLHAFQNTALELIVAMVTVWPEFLKTSSDCLSDEQCPLVHTLKLVLLSWVQKSQSADLGNILRVLCCWGDDSVTEEVLKDLGLQLIKLLHEERAASVRIGNDDGRLVLDRHSFEIVKSLELLSCVLGWQWTLNELIINNIWQILKSWADKETNDEPTNDISGGETVFIGEQDRKSTCCCNDCNVSREKSNVAVSTNEDASDGESFSTAEEKREENNQLGDEKVLDVCSKCGKLKSLRIRLPESQTVLCVQLLGILCRIAIENGQSLVPEITDLLCGLIEETSTDSKSKVTYAIQLTTATSLLDMSPWQPDRVAAVVGKWIAALKELGSLQAPAYVAQGLVCLKSILRTNQILS